MRHDPTDRGPRAALLRLRWPRATSPGRRRAARRRLLAWAVVAAVAIGVQRSTEAVSTARAAWLGDETVVVVHRSVEAGDALGPADVRVEHRPTATVPVDAVAALPPDAIAAIRLTPGTVIGRTMVRRIGRNGTAGSLPAGRVAVVVRTGDLPPLATRGDVVDVASPTWEGAVATEAEVLAVDDDAVTLAVHELDADATATASLAGPVALVLRP